MDAGAWPARRAETVAIQQPMAVVLGCADSRVPPELVFDQGPGDLFVVRVAGNVAGSTPLGSIEFAVQQLGVRLVVVLGHTGCGAVQAALQERAGPPLGLSPHLGAVVAEIMPALADFPAQLVEPTPETIASNALLATANLTQKSPVLARAVEEGNLAVATAVYDLGTGNVRFLTDDSGAESS
nr:carbonic anhydrase [Candidatus Krumholzibacteria bacterium]